jgi:LPXTG-site transpeptidase (sortase) family protein
MVNWRWWAEAACWTLGVVFLGGYGTVRWWSDSDSTRALAAFAEARAETVAAPGPLNVGSPDKSLWAPGRVKAYNASVAADKSLPEAVLKVPEIGLEVPLYPGASESNMTRGAGRVEGSPFYGEKGNVSVSSHRDGFFRKLKDLRNGQEIVVETLQGTYRYRVVDTQITDPKDTTVLRQYSPREITLITCYPFYFYGSAPERFIARAEQVDPAPGP